MASNTTRNVIELCAQFAVVCRHCGNSKARLNDERSEASYRVGNRVPRWCRRLFCQCQSGADLLDLSVEPLLKFSLGLQDSELEKMAGGRLGASEVTTLELVWGKGKEGQWRTEASCQA